jgi:4-amino-4-deoxychorismate lyase
MATVYGLHALDATGAVLRPPVAPLTDLALIRGEGVFETIRLYGGKPFRLGAHLDRLAGSAAAVGVEVSRERAEAVALAAAAGADGRDAVLRVVATKGDLDLPPDATGLGVLYGLCTAVPAGLEAERARGLSLAPLTLAADPLVRAASPWLLPAVKSTSYAVNMAASRAAHRLGADDAIFTGLGGELLESPTANLWWRTGAALFTPALDTGILAGVTRAALIELAPGLGHRVVEGVFSVDDLLGADEAFLASTVREIMPVVALVRDGRRVPIGDGAPGPAAAALQAALRALAA